MTQWYPSDTVDGSEFLANDLLHMKSYETWDVQPISTGDTQISEPSTVRVLNARSPEIRTKQLVQSWRNFGEATWNSQQNLSDNSGSKDLATCKSKRIFLGFHLDDGSEIRRSPPGMYTLR